MKNYDNAENIIVKHIAVILAIVIIVNLVNGIIPVLAISTQGFASTADIYPYNNVLFNNFETGIMSNPGNASIYGCCAKSSDDSSFGALFVSKDSSAQQATMLNLKGRSSYWSHWVYEGVDLYVNDQKWMPSYEGPIPNYECAIINSDHNGPGNQYCIDFLDYVLNDGIEVNTGNQITYNLPPGNIAIIETNNSYNNINLLTTMPLQSTSFSKNPWPNTTQRIGYYNTLPQTMNINTMGNVIEWERNGNTTLFNITTSAKYNPNVISTFKYVVISNPYYYPANDMEDRQFTNGAININMDGVVKITVKSLTATVNTQTGEIENNYNGNEWTGEIDESTNDIIWTDSNGDSNAPTNGGNLSDPSITGFQSWLKGILNNIVNIFEPAHDAISTLSGAVRNFASWMYALYVWLPSPILSLLTSAISLAIVIGIIKVFI